MGSRTQAQKAQTAAELPDATATVARARYQIERLLAAEDEHIEKRLAAAPARDLVLPELHELLMLNTTRLQYRPDVQRARAELLEAQANCVKLKRHSVRS